MAKKKPRAFAPSCVPAQTNNPHHPYDPQELPRRFALVGSRDLSLPAIAEPLSITFLRSFHAGSFFIVATVDSLSFHKPALVNLTRRLTKVLYCDFRVGILKEVVSKKRILILRESESNLTVISRTLSLLLSGIAYCILVCTIQGVATTTSHQPARAGVITASQSAGASALPLCFDQIVAIPDTSASCASVATGWSACLPIS